jgi:hypothetical protein
VGSAIIQIIASAQKGQPGQLVFAEFLLNFCKMWWMASTESSKFFNLPQNALKCFKIHNFLKFP